MKDHQDLLSTDWKNILLFDACRYDFFEKIIQEIDLEGELIKANSQAGDTRHWYEKHWSEYNQNVVLFTSSPVPRRRDFEKNFFEVFPVWKKEDWLSPENTLERALREKDEFSSKRFLIHIIPPHLPFIESDGKEFLDELGYFDAEDLNNVDGYDLVEKWGRKNGWEKLRTLYQKNLKEALKRSLPFLDQLKGKVVITSDHGEMIGENNRYNHHFRFDHPKMREVPWFEVIK